MAAQSMKAENEIWNIFISWYDTCTQHISVIDIV